ncbi:MAG: hypothetical protein AAFP77_03130 [Bacteroidota bacterium]
MRTLFLITLIYAAFTSVTWAQVQIGENLLGEAAGDHFGSAVSLSADGQRLAVGAWRNSEVSPNAGRVYVYEENAGTWETISDATAGSSNDDRFGYAVSLSADGQYLAVGAPGKATVGGVGSGQVIVYNQQGGAWVAVGTPIDGQAVGESLGTAVSLSNDGARIAVQTYTAGLGASSGKVRIYENVGGAWSQMGNDIDVANASVGNTSLSLSGDGTRMAVGAPANSGSTGRVDIYIEINGSWLPRAGITGNAQGEQFGTSVSLSASGLRMAVGSPGADNTAQDAGQLHIYEEDTGTWIVIGSMEGIAAGDAFGQTTALSADGRQVAVGAPKSDANEIDAGQVKIFEQNGSSWSQLGDDIIGRIGGIEAGTCLTLSADGSRVAIGAWKDDENGTDAGLVQVFEGFGGCSATSGVENVEACNSFTWIDGNVYGTSNNTATVTLTNAAGCDSVVTLNLVINYETDLDPSLTNDGLTLTANEEGAEYQWVRCGGGFPPVAGATSQSFTPLESGTYAVMIRKGGCAIISACQTITITDVDDLIQTVDILVFPNPADQYLTIKGFEQLVQPVIRNKLGQPVMELQQSPVDISNLPAGIYSITGMLRQRPLHLLFVKNN